MADKKDLMEYSTDELIEALNYCGYDPYYLDYRYEIIVEIKKRLNNRNPKAQTPIKPVRDTFLNWRCGNCRREIDRYAGEIYCPGCGRKVEWND